MINIPEELSARFDTVAGRRELILRYGDSPNLFVVVNADGESVWMGISHTHGITLTTHQHNGHVRVNYYDTDGHAAGETFQGRWDQ